jgi:Tfp pilus assembly protein PilO
LFFDANRKKAEIDGKNCQLLSVSIAMKSSYKDLFAYIQTLKELLPAYVTIERLEMGRDASGTSKLNVSLDLTMYLLS